MKRISSFFRENKAVWACFLSGLLLNVVIELMNRQSISAVCSLIAARPLAFLENILIITLCLSFCLFTKRKWFFAVLIGAVWAGVGIANMYVLSYRVSPLSAIDFAILQLDWSFIGIYMSVPMFVLLIIAVLLLIVGLILLFRKCPKSPVHPLRSVVILCGIVLTAVILPELPASAGFAGNAYKDVINLTEQYGFVYTFTRSLVDFGIDRPEDYSARRIHAIAADELAAEDKEPEETPNLIFLQLESFFDVNHVEGITLSEDPVPYFRSLKESCPSGFFTAPSVGAGTANTEFEVITQMNVHLFGTGEYPYKTILQDTTCESIACNLKELGYAAHVIHNNTATFYDRNIAFENLGFDTFTTIEYMNDVEYNEIGWAKDRILTSEIAEVLDSTEERDLIYTISVQPHGAYPDENEADTIQILSGIEDDELREQAEFYAAQIHEVDGFLQELTGYLETLEEPTVLVIYGDHMPAFDIENSMLDEGNTYTTEYVIWANYPLEAEDRDVTAYQLAGHVLEILGINTGTLTKFHQMNTWSGAYTTELLTLQYDMLYGDQIVYHGENPFEPTDIQFGTKQILLSKATVRGDTVTAWGENFTPYSVIYVNGDAQETQFISENEIACVYEDLPADAKVSVWQVAEDGTELSKAQAAAE